MEKYWRLIIDEAKDPYLNMAIDEAMLICQAEPGAVPTIRFYRWSYPCVSIGRFQKPLTLTLSPKGRGEGEGDNNLPIVKRPTGGGAVLHDEYGFTYSIIYREDSGAVAKGVSNSYREIHTGIAAALNALGLEARLSTEEESRQSAVLGGTCFACPVRYDVVSGGKKVAGAAQRRRFGAILHQGEVSLGLDVRSKWSYNDVSIALLNSLSKRLKAQFIEGRISRKEKDTIEGLVMEEVNR